ncbi:hypothetical protein KKC45_03655, partial [Patescibacteria group bacterium]|nr:hypothetical protein [Patescibacteria group bacterium]
QKGPEKQFKVIKLKYAVAENVVEKLTDFLGKNNRSRGMGLGPDLDEVKVIANRRLNAIIIQAYSEKMRHIIQLVNEIDQKLENEPSNIHYIRLKHADSTKLQETLSKLLESGTLTKKVSTGSRTSSPVPSGSEIKTSIQAEPQTNSLIIRAEDHEWREIEKIVKQVDVRRPQVLIEGALVEVSPDDMLGLGIELFWAETPRGDRPTFAGGSNFGFSNLAVVDKNGDAELITPTTTKITNGSTYGTVPVSSSRTDFARSATAAITYKDMFTIPAILKAIQTKQTFKILSIPSVLTNDHEQAQITVADAQPSLSKTENNSGSNTTAFEGYEKAGTTLTVTPHISGEENYLRLDLTQSINEFVDSSSSVAGVQPQRIREIKTSITVPDGQTVAIGGFTFDKETKTVEKIPFLGDLPLIGVLFQTRIVTHTKRNIYLFITPHILREKNFKDLHKHSFEYKMKAHKLGANVGMFDKSFKKYLDKYGIKKADDPSPVFMLDYRRSSDKKK